MVSANGIKCAICYDSICCDSTKYESIELTCGHTFGKSCMRKWVESSNQKKCLFCQNQITDNEIKAIKNIPLQERVVIISKKTINLFGRTVLTFAPPIAALAAAMVAVGAAVGYTVEATEAAVIGAAGITAGAAAGAAGAAVEVGRATRVAVGATVGAVGTVGVTVGTVETAGLGAAGLGAVVGAFGAVGAVAGVVGTDMAYFVQEMNPVVV